MATMTQGAIDKGPSEAQLRSDGYDHLYSDQSTLDRAILLQKFDSRDTLDGGASKNEAATFEGHDWLDGDDRVSGSSKNDPPSPCNGSTNRTVGLLRKLGVE